MTRPTNGQMMTEMYGMIKSNCTNIKNLHEDVKEINSILKNGEGKIAENRKNIALFAQALTSYIQEEARREKRHLLFVGFTVTIICTIFSTIVKLI